ncbi:nucleotidyltransferase domain-containing protein [Nitrosomonas sp. Nm84]|uniref:nucleotidyltransferase domain-containing protein n=1 Tax=Nitrosomonas sp. Nm84 TaxID=200124 RepID=UPI000D7580B8|nr:nucleotidyltransferase domain-containing protein [Nitrosomonas sp. Nm84]
MLSQLTALLSRYPQIKLAILFGSMAAGNARPDSDIDLDLLTQAPLTADFKLQLTQTIAANDGRSFYDIA